MSAKHRTETQRIPRRMRTLRRRAEHLGRTIGDPEGFAAIHENARNYILAEHNALLWALRQLDERMPDIMAAAAAQDTQADINDAKEHLHADPV